MILVLSIAIPVIIFLIALGTVAIIQRHWIKKERRSLEGVSAAAHSGSTSQRSTCRECGATGPELLFIGGVCLNCYEQRRRKDEADGHGLGFDGTDSEMAPYYRILGCNETDSEEEIRRQYHKRAKEVHPDALQGQHPPENLIKRRTAEFRELQEAYDKIREQRSMQR
jgi:hypothetical protein